jgi:hypothetical protein
MTQSLAEVAASLRASEATVEHGRAAIARVALSPDAFGAHATGRLGAVGAQLQQLWEAALDDRLAEASDMVGRLDEAADAIGTAAGRYLDAEQTTRPGWAGN